MFTFMPDDLLPQRKMIQRSFRIPLDQYAALRAIARNKHHGLRNVSDLIREALEQFIERENKRP